MLPPETESRLRLYLTLLEKWQARINLVGPATLAEAWERHVLDSLRVADHIPARADGVKTPLFDLGSGAGFPGLVLAVARPDLDVTLIESDHRKCAFLSTVSRETHTPVTILNQRIEAVDSKTIPAILTARALAPVDRLLDYAAPWAVRNPALRVLFLKGEGAAAEIEAARARHVFDACLHPGAAGQGPVVEIAGLPGKA